MDSLESQWRRGTDHSKLEEWACVFKNKAKKKPNKVKILIKYINACNKTYTHTHIKPKQIFPHADFLLA